MENVTQQEQGEREIFEDAYYKAVDQARSIIAAAQALALPALIPEMQQVARPEAAGNVEIKLPTLKLPTFSGEYDQWMLFKDAFQSLIHDNRKLSNVQRF